MDKDLENKINTEFEEIYKTKIEPKIKSLEVYRLQEKKKYDTANKICMIFIALIILDLSIVVMFQNESTPIFLLLFIIFLSIVIIFSNISQKTSNNFRKKIKESFLPPFLSSFGTFHIGNTELITLKDIKNLGLYPYGRTKVDDDIILGKHKGLPITLMDTAITHSTQSGKNSHEVYDFSGLIVKVKMNKTFKGKTVGKSKMSFANLVKIVKIYMEKNPENISPKMKNFVDTVENVVNNPIFGSMEQTAHLMKKHNMKLTPKGLEIKLGPSNKPKGLDEVTLEDPEFNANYDVFSNDQIEARYLLTTSFMERLLDLQIVFLTPNIDFVFYNDYLYLFIHKGREKDETGFLEVGGINDTLINKSIYSEAFKELSTIFSVVDHLKLDTRIGL